MSFENLKRGRGFIVGLTAMVALPFCTVALAQSFAPVAVVNDQVITGYDVEQRALLNSVIGERGAGDTAAALDDVIEDVLRVQAAKRAGISLSPADVQEGFAEISRLNRRDPSQMRNSILSRGVSAEALDAQVEAEVAWRQLIVQRFGARATNASQGDKRQPAVAASTTLPSETEYQLAEIRTPIGAGGEAAARASAQQVVAQLKNGARFSEVARANSAGPTSAAGGDLGWVRRSQLSAQFLPVVSVMNVNRISEPFVDGSDVVIVGLRGSRESGGSDTSSYRLAQLVVGVSPSASQAEADAALARATAVRAEINSCADVTARQASYLPISGDLGELTLAAMPGPVREAVSGLETGQKTQPVRSNDGFHIIVVCNKTTGAAPAPTRQAQANSSGRSQRLDRYARSFLRELKREAIIERR